MWGYATINEGLTAGSPNPLLPVCHYCVSVILISVHVTKSFLVGLLTEQDIFILGYKGRWNYFQEVAQKRIQKAELRKKAQVKGRDGLSSQV